MKLFSLVVWITFLILGSLGVGIYRAVAKTRRMTLLEEDTYGYGVTFCYVIVFAFYVVWVGW